jgi:enoyl-CoA hydratase
MRNENSTGKEEPLSQELAYYEIEGQIAIVTIDHPPINALDPATKERIGKVFTELDDHRQEVRVVILRGAGERAFAAGADIKTFLELTPETAKRRLMRSHQIYSMVEDFEWPVIAAIHGFCLGGGLELGFPEVNLSIFPGNGGLQRSLFHMSLGRLKELAYTGRLMTAQEAFEYGLVEKVLPDEQVMDGARELAKDIACRGPLGVAAAKKVLNRTRGLTLDAGLELELDLWAGLTATEDMKEGARAFVEKRKPTYRCR